MVGANDRGRGTGSAGVGWERQEDSARRGGTRRQSGGEAAPRPAGSGNIRDFGGFGDGIAAGIGGGDSLALSMQAGRAPQPALIGRHCITECVYSALVQYHEIVYMHGTGAL